MIQNSYQQQQLSINLTQFNNSTFHQWKHINLIVKVLHKPHTIQPFINGGKVKSEKGNMRRIPLYPTCFNSHSMNNPPTSNSRQILKLLTMETLFSSTSFSVRALSNYADNYFSQQQP